MFFVVVAAAVTAKSLSEKKSFNLSILTTLSRYCALFNYALNSSLIVFAFCREKNQISYAISKIYKILKNVFKKLHAHVFHYNVPLPIIVIIIPSYCGNVFSLSTAAKARNLWSNSPSRNKLLL